MHYMLSHGKMIQTSTSILLSHPPSCDLPWPSTYHMDKI